MRAGDGVKAKSGVGAAPAGIEGVVSHINGRYVYVYLNSNGFNEDWEFYPNELEVINSATDAEHKEAIKRYAEEVIKTQRRIIEEAEKIIVRMQETLK